LFCVRVFFDACCTVEVFFLWSYFFNRDRFFPSGFLVACSFLWPSATRRNLRPPFLPRLAPLRTTLFPSLHDRFFPFEPTAWRPIRLSRQCAFSGSLVTSSELFDPNFFFRIVPASTSCHPPRFFFLAEGPPCRSRSVLLSYFVCCHFLVRGKRCGKFFPPPPPAFRFSGLELP